MLPFLTESFFGETSAQFLQRLHAGQRGVLESNAYAFDYINQKIANKKKRYIFKEDRYETLHIIEDLTAVRAKINILSLFCLVLSSYYSSKVLRIFFKYLSQPSVVLKSGELRFYPPPIQNKIKKQTNVHEFRSMELYSVQRNRSSTVWLHVPFKFWRNKPANIQLPKLFTVK